MLKQNGEIENSRIAILRMTFLGCERLRAGGWGWDGGIFGTCVDPQVVPIDRIIYYNSPKKYGVEYGQKNAFVDSLCWGCRCERSSSDS